MPKGFTDRMKAMIFHRSNNAVSCRNKRYATLRRAQSIAYENPLLTAAAASRYRPQIASMTSRSASASSRSTPRCMRVLGRDLLAESVRPAVTGHVKNICDPPELACLVVGPKNCFTQQVAVHLRLGAWSLARL